MLNLGQRCLVATLLLATFSTAFGQGTFQNLGFESATLVPVPGDPFERVQFASAFPNWVGYVGTNQASRVRLDAFFLDLATHSILQSNNSPIPLIEGSYTPVLQAGYDPNEFPQPTTLVSVALAQTGVVPFDNLSLRFLAVTAGAQFAVTLGAQNIPVVVLQTFPSYTLYGGDISAFAGTTAELRFTAFPNNYPHLFALDAIEFSTEPIPEPSAVGLFALGALLLGWGLRRKP